jgi:hypothetical protein
VRRLNDAEEEEGGDDQAEDGVEEDDMEEDIEDEVEDAAEESGLNKYGPRASGSSWRARQ